MTSEIIVSDKGNAKFLMNSNTAVRLRTIKDSTGRFLWAPTGNLIEGVEHPLLGYQVEIDEGTLGATAAYQIEYIGKKRFVRLALTKAGGTSIQAGAIALPALRRSVQAGS